GFEKLWKDPDTKLYQDFRKMFIEHGDEIDAVGVTTHDSTHFAPSYMALEMGKALFVQKPLAHSIYEVRTLQEKANEKGVVTQMGNQGHAFEGMNLIKEWYEAGLIGDVKEVIAWTNRPAAGFGFGKPRHATAYPKGQQLHKGLDWDIWLGPVQEKIEYHEWYHPIRWRAWWDFGCGGLGDIGCHTIDAPFWALDLGNPTTIDVEVEEVNPVFTPKGSVVTYHFPARGSKPPVTLKWYEGPKMPPKPQVMGNVELHKEGGMIMIGEKGAIYHPGMRPNSPRMFPESMWEKYRTTPPEQRVPKTLPRVKGIFEDWLNCVKTGGKCVSDFNYSAPLTEVIVLGTMAIRTGKAVTWDPKGMKVTDNPEANKLVNPPAREGWRVEDLTPDKAGKYVKA
ncbi:MAG: Gfo/Idh/MocA family oxidoreductase, partial [Rhodospirillales bacterium]|nr:Gfo/Idh/MocA family oxidoreductase [Rhodospirillales bacterium]